MSTTKKPAKPVTQEALSPDTQRLLEQVGELVIDGKLYKSEPVTAEVKEREE